MPEESRPKNIKKKDRPSLKETIMPEQKETKPEPEETTISEGMSSISVVVGEVSIGISVPDTPLQDIAQITVDILRNIVELQRGEVEDLTEPEGAALEQTQTQDKLRGLDLEGNAEYEKLMGNLKEDPRRIVPPEEPPKKKGFFSRQNK